MLWIPTSHSCGFPHCSWHVQSLFSSSSLEGRFCSAHRLPEMVQQLKQKARNHILLQFCLLPLNSPGRVDVLLVNWGMFSSADPSMRTVLREQRTEITDRREQIDFEGKPEESFSWNCLCVARLSQNKIQIKHFDWNLQKSLKLSK